MEPGTAGARPKVTTNNKAQTDRGPDRRGKSGTPRKTPRKKKQAVIKGDAPLAVQSKLPPARQGNGAADVLGVSETVQSRLPPAGLSGAELAELPDDTVSGTVQSKLPPVRQASSADVLGVSETVQSRLPPVDVTEPADPPDGSVVGVVQSKLPPGRASRASSPDAQQLGSTFQSRLPREMSVRKSLHKAAQRCARPVDAELLEALEREILELQSPELSDAEATAADPQAGLKRAESIGRARSFVVDIESLAITARRVVDALRSDHFTSSRAGYLLCLQDQVGPAMQPPPVG